MTRKMSERSKNMKETSYFINKTFCAVFTVKCEKYQKPRKCKKLPEKCEKVKNKRQKI